jgi:trehalose/maltose transport system substrate-binding protein
MRWLAAATAGPILAFGATAKAAEISISCSALGKEYEICKEGVDAWAKKTSHKVKIVSTPNSATERLAVYQQLLAAGAGDIDVFQMDVVWPGILGQHFLNLTPKAQGQTAEHFPHP